MAALNQNSDALLATVNVDMNTGTAQGLYTVPSGLTSCIVTKVVIYNASVSLTTASVSFGWTGATYNDVILDATYTALSAADLSVILSPIVGAKVGGTSDTFYVKANILQGVPATALVLVFGILQ